ncbi:guanine nucleotide-binding protein subunit alpha-12-like [Myxocyprinus asiaticus]|uniref:guanine nucleotide-binding protein subunit alpha-12-like n=1 Tax=Myxocyprinus asiaticus TaxID=70543 RepID=UPI002223C4FA|nr:guanine nucleotide-binding protein subunit alpha-12-like [Myxocyprinus asiaticus]
MATFSATEPDKPTTSTDSLATDPAYWCKIDETGENGKSAFLRQESLINGEEFSHKEMLESREAVYENIIQPSFTSSVAYLKCSTGYFNTSPCTFQLYSSAIVSLWKDSGIQETYQRRSEFQLISYIPSNQDILYAHKSMKATAEHYFMFRNISFMITNVGGLCFQKPRLFHYFDNINVILFMASSSEFDQIRMEDNCTNCLVKSLNMFETIINNFLKTSIIHFLNETDLLEEKVCKVDIRQNFPEFQGDPPRRMEDVQAFLVQCFRWRRNHSQLLFYHFTTTVNTENIRFLFHDVNETIIIDNNRTSKTS